MALGSKLGVSVWREVNTRMRVLDFVLGNRRYSSDGDDR